MEKEIKPSAFIDKQGNKITKESYMAKKIGKAYALMDLETSLNQIRAELPQARKLAMTPSQLEISVREVKDLMTDKTADSDLIEYINKESIYPIFPEKYKSQKEKAKQKKISDLRYILEAKYPNATNEQAAGEISDITNYLYYAFGNDKPFNAVIIGKDLDGEYCLWEND